jgi:hypothetical protein
MFIAERPMTYLAADRGAVVAAAQSWRRGDGVTWWHGDVIAITVA